ncbi:hypothetical protein HPP92_014945 [Vanilla planifolia]|uniref:Uncharacterized protein n=1 Tax=Vanilla planifolia TaxID=51239 RepID=A0A835QR42_VANPL|nr:hypothetical protein HPP92_014945 [Vanilla planifolia]
MRYLAPRKVWPPMAFAASMACWYEHVSRTICLIICRQHRLWNFLIRVITFNSYALQSKLPRARLNVVEGKDHITVVTGQQKTFVAELEKIWKEVKN